MDVVANFVIIVNQIHGKASILDREKVLTASIDSATMVERV